MAFNPCYVLAVGGFILDADENAPLATFLREFFCIDGGQFEETREHLGLSMESLFVPSASREC